jgi:predicted DNA-binding antitoxin AbrB/MazE fold protein
MTSHLAATYANGVFRPKQPVNLPENSEVNLIFETVVVAPPETPSPDWREAMAAFIQRCKESPLHTGAVWNGRDELYDDRI